LALRPSAAQDSLRHRQSARTRRLRCRHLASEPGISASFRCTPHSWLRKDQIDQIHTKGSGRWHENGLLNVWIIVESTKDIANSKAILRTHLPQGDLRSLAWGRLRHDCPAGPNDLSPIPSFAFQGSQRASKRLCSPDLRTTQGFRVVLRRGAPSSARPVNSSLSSWTDLCAVSLTLVPSS